MYAYNSEDELIENHPKSEDEPISTELRHKILNGYDPYNNGYIGKDIIKLRITDDGVFLAEPISFHAGQ